MTELLLITLAMRETGTLMPRRQEHRLATLAPRLGREDGRIRWKNDTRDIVSLIRGLSPSPCSYTFFEGKQMKIYLAKAETTAVTEAPGTVVGETDAGLRVAAGDGYVLLKEMQIEGKKRLAVRDFLRGVRIAPGQVLG
jgi:methionyl-tRNA formyltransferase